MKHRLNGIKLPHLKGTQNSETMTMSAPEKIILPMAMNMGAPCEPLVKVGDEVLVGQKVGDSQEFFSLPVHSGISGKVSAISDMLLSNGRRCKTLIIESDGKQTLHPDIAPPTIRSKEDFIKAVKEAGVCGLGGAGFPTHMKFGAKTPIDTLIINAAECEPYITSDNREMIEHTDDIFAGVRMVMKWIGIPRTVIAIEGNKPEAIKLLTERAANDDDIEILSLPCEYPQGAEKVIIYSATGRIVPEGKLPSDVNVIVLNVSTVAYINRYIKTGMPLVKRRVTVEGDCANRPCNVEAYIGTPAVKLIQLADVNTEKMHRLIAGGLMMGACQISMDYPVMKTTNALIALSRNITKEETACIRCGCCARTCPLKLMPTEIERAYKLKDVELLKKLKVTLCMNCGCCTYACPANHRLSEINQLAKALIPRK